MVPRPLATAIVVVVSAVWVGNFAASVFVPEYQNDPAINFVFATIVGGALALRGGDDPGQPGVWQRVTAAVRHPPPPTPPAPPAPPASVSLTEPARPPADPPAPGEVRP